MAIPVTRWTDPASDLAQPVAAGSTALYTAQIVDEAGAALGASGLTTLVLSIVDAAGAIINGVDAQDILNADRGLLDAGGNLSISLKSADTALDAGITEAIRSLVIKWTWGDSRKGEHQVDFKITALSA